MSRIKKYIKKIRYGFDKEYFRRVNFRNWVRSVFLTLKYVDEFNVFPPIQLEGNISLKIIKDAGSRLEIFDRLYVVPWLNLGTPAIISLKKNSCMTIENKFTIGNNVKIFLNQKAKLYLGGRKKESGSGITADAVLMIDKEVNIGYDCIVAWNTFITDSDWHSIKGKEYTIPTMIGDHVWVGVGAKILKGANIKKGTIITSNSVVLQGEYASNSLISGMPAKVVKNNIPEWCRDMKHW